MEIVGNSSSTVHLLWAISVLSGVIMCKIVYDITGLISRAYFKGYNSLSKSKKIEWNNRGFSTFHAILVSVVSFYLLVISDLFKEGSPTGFIVHRKSLSSDTLFGISIGYFLTDIVMILWYFPALGGMEYIFHHGFSLYAIILSLLSGQAQYYILMVLFSEITTPFVNLRWYLDAYGQKDSMLYFFNGVAMFLGWLVARILLFIFFFVDIYLHFDEVRTMFPLGFYSILSIPPLIAVMNAYWFFKISKGLFRTVSRKIHPH